MKPVALSRTRAFWLLFTILAVLPISSQPQPLPHQQWFLDDYWSVPGGANIHLDTDSAGNIYVYRAGDSFGIRIYDASGNLLNPTKNPRIEPNISGVSFALTDDDRVVFAGFVGGSGAIELCDPALPDACVANNQLIQAGAGGYDDVVVAEDDTIYAVASFDGGRIFNLAGSVLSSGPAFGPTDDNSPPPPGFLKGPFEVSLLSGRVLVNDTDGVHLFDRSGSFLSRFLRPPGGGLLGGSGEIYLFTQAVFTALPLPPYATAAVILDPQGQEIGFVHNSPALDLTTDDSAFAGPDQLYAVGEFSVFGTGTFLVRYRRSYRAYDPALRSIPIPEILSAASRPGTSLFDVDYIVHDADSATVTTGLIALEDGQVNLAAVRRLVSTTGPVGPGVSSGVIHTVTWDAGVDLAGAGDFIDAQIQAMAKDERVGLFPIHFLTIPSAGPAGCADLTINVSPISDGEMLDAWFWLVATGDPAISLNAGQVVGVGGAFDGLVLAQGVTTTADGRAFLFERMMVREATNAEVQCVKEATTPGLVNQFVPINRFGNHPELVNEFGFDTGTTVAGFWVVPLP